MTPRVQSTRGVMYLVARISTSVPLVFARGVSYAHSMSTIASLPSSSVDDPGGPGGIATGAHIIERALEQLRAHRTEWARLDVREKIVLLERVRAGVGEVAEAWVREAARAKGFDPESPLAVEEWLTGPWALLFAINHYLESLRDIADIGVPRLPKNALRTRHDGQLTVRVFPHNWY